MSDPLYAKDLLRLAANAIGAGKLNPCDAEGHAHNPACGDKVTMTLCLTDEGHISQIAHETSACVLAQASASILGDKLQGTDVSTVKKLREHVSAMLNAGPTPPAPFTEYSVLMGAATFRNRHNCVLLPIDAVLNAFEHRLARDENS